MKATHIFLCADESLFICSILIKQVVSANVTVGYEFLALNLIQSNAPQLY